MGKVRLPPFEVEKLKGVRLLKELTNWAFIRFKIKEIWKYTQGEAVRVGILDTGCEHEDIKVEKSKDFTGEGNFDKSGHGTWIAGVIKAANNFLGIAPKCELYIAKVLTSDGSGNWNWMREGLKWLEEENCQVINISAGGDYYGEAIQPILKRLAEKGVIILCAAGNANDKLIFPANSPYTIAVGAINKEEEKASFSNFGPGLTVMAPGKNLLGCWLNNGYAKLSGTSMACPEAASIPVLELVLRPMNLEGAIKRFSETSKDIGKIGWDKKTGWGIVDPKKFLLIKEEPKKISSWLGLLLILLLFIFKTPIVAAKQMYKGGNQ